MSALPEKWEMRPISELGKVLTGNTPPTSDLSNYGDYLPFIKPTQLVDAPVSSGEQSLSKKGCEKSRVVPKGGVLVSCIGNLGKTAIAKREVAFNQQINAVIFNEVIPEYGFYYFQTLKFRKQLNDLSSATTISIVNKSKFESISIPIAPLEQQKQIVAKIEELFSHIDAGIDALKQSKQLLKQYRQSVLKAAVTGELSKEWREQNKDKLEPASKLLERILQERRQKWEAQQLEQFKAKGKVPKDEGWKAKYKGPSAPDAEGFPEIPEEWIWSGFEQVTSPEKNSMKAGPFGSALKKHFYTESGYKIYGQEQVINGDPYYGDYYISEDKYQSLISCAIKPGDFLISLVGTIGKTLVLPEDCEPGIINPRLIKITFDKNICSPNYAKIYVSSPVVKGIFSLSSHGGTMDVLNMNSLKSLPFPLPPLYEQKIICVEVDRIFTVIESMEKSIDSELQRSERLKQSVLQSAFDGGLI